MPKGRFSIGDEVCLTATVRLIDVAGEGTVTVELGATGQRVTLMANSTGIQLVEAAKGSAGFIKTPKGRQGRLIPDRNDG